MLTSGPRHEPEGVGVGAGGDEAIRYRKTG